MFIFMPFFQQPSKKHFKRAELVEKEKEEYWKKYGSQGDEIPSDVYKPATGNVIFLYIGVLYINRTPVVLILC